MAHHHHHHHHHSHHCPTRLLPSLHFHHRSHYQAKVWIASFWFHFHTTTEKKCKKNHHYFADVSFFAVLNLHAHIFNFKKYKVLGSIWHLKLNFYVLKHLIFLHMHLHIKQYNIIVKRQNKTTWNMKNNVQMTIPFLPWPKPYLSSIKNTNESDLDSYVPESIWVGIMLVVHGSWLHLGWVVQSLIKLTQG